jgi:hypothetical protein
VDEGVTGTLVDAVVAGRLDGEAEEFGPQAASRRASAVKA